jgi:hypothetical protein
LIVVNEAREKPLTVVISGGLPLGTGLFAALRAIAHGDRVHLLWRQLLGDAHLLADVGATSPDLWSHIAWRVECVSDARRHDDDQHHGENHQNDEWRGKFLRS